jgi:membrane protease YdiL (CAAX protease family)
VTARDLPPPTPVLKVVRLLWAAARRRAAGRARRQQEIMGRCTDKGADRLGGLGRIAVLLLMCGVHAALGWFGPRLAPSTGTVEVVRVGKIALAAQQWRLLDDLGARQKQVLARKQEVAAKPNPRFEDRQVIIKAERARDDAMSRLVYETKANGRRLSAEEVATHRAAVEQLFAQQGAAGFTRIDDSFESQLRKSRETPMVIVPIMGLVLACWLGMLICQGEGLELDVQRRRHPMWEWLLSHPIRPAHAFYAELLAPLMANPVYFAALLFPWVLLGSIFGSGPGFLAALCIGLPIAVATSGLNKATETWALLRLGVRTRGAVLGVISWVGYVAMFVPLLTLQIDGVKRPMAQLGAWLDPGFPAWPVRVLLWGWGDARSLVEVVIAWWVVAAALGALALWVTQRATSRGLQAPSETGGPAGAKLLSVHSRFGAHPLLRKELLWLIRDKSAVVQVILIPLTIATTQAFNFRGLYNLTNTGWSAVCGVAIICGTYFLLVLGPRSLASEGAALWLALTWPRGLEDLLKAKARLWSRVANVVVGVILVVTAVMFPEAWWKIALVGGGWLVFSSTLALKSVSLVTVPSSSGEPEPPNRARHWIAMVGTLAFGTGVVTGSWHVAIVGIVFSSLVAVAMWQNLRARLPYLFDRWSEQPVPAPSLLHATVGIALLVEGIAVFMGVAGAMGGASGLWWARALGYGIAGIFGCVFMQHFLSGRGVSVSDILTWSGERRRFAPPQGMILGAGAGVGLAVLAGLYMLALRWVPAARDSLDEAAKFAESHAGAKPWIFLMAVGFAPLAEEYFFRGLLFRTLDRELGDWRAAVLSAAFFAIFHPPLAWIPVACLGLVTAWLFRNTRHLLPCVVCHMAYNAMLFVLPA